MVCGQVRIDCISAIAQIIQLVIIHTFLGDRPSSIARFLAAMKAAESSPYQRWLKDIPSALEEEMKSCKTSEDVLALAKREGYKLTEEELDAVSGGEWSCSDLATTDTRVV